MKDANPALTIMIAAMPECLRIVATDVSTVMTGNTSVRLCRASPLAR